MNKFHKQQLLIKRFIDLVFSLLVIIFLHPLMIITIIIQTIETRSFGVFTQKRVGKNGKEFNIYKIRTMKNDSKITTNVTARNDIRITKIGRFLRKSKIDELPQFINVLLGDMSVVGPRPDTPDFVNKLPNKDKFFLKMKPGITGLSSIFLIDEEKLLENANNPEEYNLKTIWPQKNSINKKYIDEWSILLDIKIIIKTMILVLRRIITK